MEDALAMRNAGRRWGKCENGVKNGIGVGRLELRERADELRGGDAGVGVAIIGAVIDCPGGLRVFWNWVCLEGDQEVWFMKSRKGKMEGGGADGAGGGGFFNEMDITQALRGWAFQPGQVNVRLIRGNDGKPKLQLRLDLGLLQMELDGRPDGRRPHRAATELEFQKKKLVSHEKKIGSDSGFALTGRECQSLREESAMFYHRYLSMFVLVQYDAVVRDSKHNLDVLDLCRRYGKSDYDRLCLEQYRPYILMMNTRAKACEALRQGYVKTSLAYLRGGIRQIAHLAPKEHRRKFLRQSNEARILLDMIKQIRAQLPQAKAMAAPTTRVAKVADPREELEKQLREAVRAEKYEEAARLRDQLTEVKRMMAEPASDASREEDKGQGVGGMPGVPVKGKKVRKKRARKEPGE